MSLGHYRHKRELARRSCRVKPVEILVLALLGATLIVPMPGGFRAPWIGCLQDLAHVPLFAAIAWVLGRVIGGRTTAAAAVALGVVMIGELLQVFVGRSPSIADAVRGVCGIGVFVGWQLAGKYAIGWRRAAGRLAVLGLGAGLPLAAAWPTLADSIASWRQFPILADFTSRWQDRRWSMQDCRLICEPDGDGNGVGILRCEPHGKSVCAIILFPIRRDWSGFRRLDIGFTVEDGPLPVTLSVRDGRPVTPPQRRFDRREIYDIGGHRVSIDLAEVARGSGETAPIDVSAVESFHFIVEPPSAACEVRLERIWLN
jgi:hypothetical protein